MCKPIKEMHFKVMSTIVTIFNNYKKEHPNINTYEFVGNQQLKENADSP